MRTVKEIIDHIDHVISVVPGAAILSDEDWKTVKETILNQWTNTTKAKKCIDFVAHDICVWQSDMYCESSPCMSVPRKGCEHSELSKISTNKTNPPCPACGTQTVSNYSYFCNNSDCYMYHK